MKSNYKKLGNYIQQVNIKNKDLQVSRLLGINIDKFFMPSVANIVGTNMANYKVVKKDQFACNRMHVGRDYRIPIALSNSDEDFLVSPAYTVFEIIDEEILFSEYLMMWFSRSEFDRNAWFYTDADVRGGLHWDAFYNMELPIPSIEKQREIVKEYNVVVDRIKLNEKMCEKLEESAQAVYREWFVDFEFSNEDGQPYKSSGGEMVWCEVLGKEVPRGWEVKELGDIANIKMGQSPLGESYNEGGNGEIFYQGRTEFGFRFPTIKMYTTEPKRMAKKGDILMSVRAPVGDLNITNFDCCIGRGIASLSSKSNHNSFLFYLLKNLKEEFTISNGEGTIFGSINKDTLNEIKELEPEEMILKNFEESVNKIDKKIQNLCFELQNLKELKDLLLSKIAI